MLETTIHVRPARPEDLPVIGRMGATLVRFHHELDPRRFFTTDNLEQGYTWFLGRQLAHASAVVLVAARSEDGEVVGYAYGALGDRDWEMLLDNHGALHDVYVDPS